HVRICESRGVRVPSATRQCGVAVGGGGDGLDRGGLGEALQLVDSMTTDDISGYQDEYRQALEALIEAKAEGRQPPNPSTEAEEPGGKAVDLMAAPQESVRKAQAARGEDAGDAEVHEMPTAKKKTAGKAAGKVPRRARSSRGTERRRLSTA
ncbi:hypothetical protein ACFXHL_52445, partial [Streptomyces mirabilis]